MSEEPKRGKFRKFSRRSFIVIGGLGTAGIVSALYYGSANQGQPIYSQGTLPSGEQPSVTQSVQTEAEVIPEQTLDELARYILPGGPGKDGIPAIDRPKFISADEANKFLSNEDVVFGLQYQGVVRAYPQTVLVWHEIVNENINGEKITVTYCPLTGSAVAFKGFSKVDGSPLTFGVSGKLVNSNLIMYDRQTDSYWPQILGAAFMGPNKGSILDQIPVTLTSWELWRKTHPETQVLSKDTGFIRIYGTDPYGKYTKDGPVGGRYYSFPVRLTDDRLHPKKVVTGVIHRGSYLAIPKEEFKSVRVANTELGGDPMVAIYDDAEEIIRVFSRRVGNKELTFRISGSGVVDTETGSEWSVKGEGLAGSLSGKQLRPLKFLDVMWFAWYAFYPQTLVYG